MRSARGGRGAKERVNEEAREGGGREKKKARGLERDRGEKGEGPGVRRRGATGGRGGGRWRDVDLNPKP